MSEVQETRAERMARYKEERRKELASQFACLSEPHTFSKRRPVSKEVSSSSEEPRATRASRLRAATTNHDSSSSLLTKNEKEKNPLSLPSSGDLQGSIKLERDKSSKRKSNLNRSLNSEEVPQFEGTDDVLNRRRRRRFFPPEVLQQAAKDLNNENSKSDNFTASVTSSTAPPITRTTLKKSELSIHMENARKGHLVSYSDMGKYSKASIRKTKEKLSKPLSTSDVDCNYSHSDSSSSTKLANKENLKSNTKVSHKQEKSKLPILDNDQPATKQRRSLNISKRMDELTALTREALARVERLTHKTRDTSKSDGDVKKSSTPTTKLRSTRAYESSVKDSSRIDEKLDTKADNRVPLICDLGKVQTHSILKKKSLDESVIEVVPVVVHNPHISAPVSILKRKVSQDEFRLQGGTPPTSTPPVTFSPNVVDPASNRRKQGILKKRRSLDESQVLRHRSCSPEVVLNGKSDSRSILKNQRRSSLEEVLRTRSPESGLHSILKRRTSKNEEDIDPPINSPEPHGILKRRSGTSSAGSNSNSPHVSIATAVILAAAGGAEMILEPTEPVRPILKKKSFSEEQPGDCSINEVPKPILKKKSSTDTEDCDDKPKKPILKNAKSLQDERDSEGLESLHHSSSFKYAYQKSDDSLECEVKPILKQGASRENSPRPRLSFYSDEFSSSTQTTTNVSFKSQRSSRRSHTVCTDVNIQSLSDNLPSEDREFQKDNNMSVRDMVLNIEKRLSTGAIPKNSNTKRTSERYRTQPVTYHELEASLNSVQNSFQPDLSPSNFLHSPVVLPSGDNANNSHSLLDLTSFDVDSNLSNLFSTSLPNTTFDSGICNKMSSDSAFQSLGDGLELEYDEKTSPSPQPTKILSDKTQSSKFQMKALAEEAKSLQLKRRSDVFKCRNRKTTDASERPNASRFSTQPVTLDEVEEASKLQEDTSDNQKVDFKLDERNSARLSISERIKLFTANLLDNQIQKSKSRFSRFQTQPVTLEEVESARVPIARKRDLFAIETDVDDAFSQKERKGILKSKSGVPPLRKTPQCFQDSLKSVLKKQDVSKRLESPPRGLRSILKPESADFARDEGISSDDSHSGSEVESSVKVDSDKECVEFGARLGRTSGDKSHLNKLSYSKNNDLISSDDANLTSDGDSSGGREVRSIMERGAFKRSFNRFSNEGSLLKSKSQGIVRDEEKVNVGGVRRSVTHSAMPKSIAELQAKLQKSGDSDWRKRIPKLNNANEELSLLNVKNIYNEELTEKTSILAARKDELDAASKQWRNRVEQSDAVNFSVAGRMQQENDVPTIPIIIPKPDKIKRTPKAKAFKGKEGGEINNETSSTPVSPEKSSVTGFKRSISLPGAGDQDPAGDDDASFKSSSRKVKVERPDNITFTSFFKSLDSKIISDTPDISVDDFDSISRHSEDLLVQKRTVRVQRKHEASRNPIKALAARADIQDEYTEILTGIAERETHRLNVEKLAKSSNFAVEALAGLASKEDFSSVALKRSSSWNSAFPPYKDLMLLQIKGRRYVQTRLVEPIASSINEGDNFILITPNSIYNYVGAYANIIEQSRAADIVNSIQQSNDLGCKCDKIVTINSKKINSCSNSDLENFWKLLGSFRADEVAAAGHPDEDEIYESSILGTNMIYEYNNEELIPLETYWGAMPKIQMLSPLKTFVFDFGSEMYVWSGKNALLEDKKKAMHLAKELWNEGYNYTDCGISPIDISSMLGLRQQRTAILKEATRPKWTLFGKITQHRETVLFKEKFLDWPDYSRVIRVKRDDHNKSVEAKFDFIPCDVSKMCNKSYIEPDLEIDGFHLGRGKSYYDEETKRLFNFSTRAITCWVISEYSHELLDDKSIGQFHDGNSYIIKWEYFANITGRELSGKPSKHVQAGKDHCVYFCWQGNNATVNEKGAAALLTINLDSENARQIQVLQGSEPPVFLNLFKGHMVLHRGKREKSNVEKCRLYICRGEVESEVFLTEVPCSMRHLRSRASFILINNNTGSVIVWNGCKATNQCKQLAKKAAENIVENHPVEFGFSEKCNNLDIVNEGAESEEFLTALGEKRQLYMSLLKSTEMFNYTPRLFHLSSISGSFEAVEILGSCRSENITPYPFLQSDLYSANQPALFMFDNGHEVWLWQGWWPELENDITLIDQTGSGAVRWQEERKAAMQTVVNYYDICNNQKRVPAYLVWAGLEPLAFTNLFPFWRDYDDVTERNINIGRKSGEITKVEEELALLIRSTYPLQQLLQRPLPDGVDPTHLENYLSAEDFSDLMSMTLEEFQKLPTWKQTSVKKEKGLF